MLKIRTLPIAMKRYGTVAEMEAIKGVRRPKAGRLHTTCQLVTQARIAGFTLGITTENLSGRSRTAAASSAWISRRRTRSTARIWTACGSRTRRPPARTRRT